MPRLHAPGDDQIVVAVHARPCAQPVSGDSRSEQARWRVDGNPLSVTVHTPGPAPGQKAATHEVSERSERGADCGLGPGPGV